MEDESDFYSACDINYNTDVVSDDEYFIPADAGVSLSPRCHDGGKKDEVIKRRVGTLPFLLKEECPTKKRTTIFLATQTITRQNIFLNGLFQNILFLYDMLTMMGYDCYLLYGDDDVISAEKDMHVIGSNVKRCHDGGSGICDKYTAYFSHFKYICLNDYIRGGISVGERMKVDLYIEIGMTIDNEFRKMLVRQNNNAKIVKLYLGNTLNIDIEHSCIGLKNNSTFCTHALGLIHQVWTSPHYKNNAEYLGVINGLPPSKKYSKIVPYVWDSTLFMKGLGVVKKECSDPLLTDIIIVEPNISFQKSALIPFQMACEFYKKYPEWKGKVRIYNAWAIENSSFWNEVFSKSELYKEGRVELCSKRMAISDIIVEAGNAVFVTNQVTNDLNYIVLELMTAGIPVVHNSNTWREFGYAYSAIEFKNSIGVLHNAVFYHELNSRAYMEHAHELVNSVDIYNEEVRAKWKTVIEDILK